MVNIRSLQSIRIKVFYSNMEGVLDKKPYPASGFICSYNDDLYLITNYHVISGKSPYNGLSRDPNGREHPTEFLVHTNFDTVNGLNSSVEIRMNYNTIIKNTIYEEGNDVCIVKLGFSITSSNKNFKIQFIDINKEIKALKHLKIEVTDSVYVVGHPLGLDIQGLPIWKHGTIASEPDIKILVEREYRNCYYIDSKTKVGMSGSPVFHRNINTGNLSLVGIYSGRDKVMGNEEGFKAELGIVRDLERSIKNLFDKIEIT